MFTTSWISLLNSGSEFLLKANQRQFISKTKLSLNVSNLWSLIGSIVQFNGESTSKKSIISPNGVDPLEAISWLFQEVTHPFHLEEPVLLHLMQSERDLSIMVEGSGREIIGSLRWKFVQIILPSDLLTSKVTSGWNWTLHLMRKLSNVISGDLTLKSFGGISSVKNFKEDI